MHKEQRDTTAHTTGCIKYTNTCNVSCWLTKTPSRTGAAGVTARLTSVAVGHVDSVHPCYDVTGMAFYLRGSFLNPETSSQSWGKYWDSPLKDIQLHAWSTILKIVKAGEGRDDSVFELLVALTEHPSLVPNILFGESLWQLQSDTLFWPHRHPQTWNIHTNIHTHK